MDPEKVDPVVENIPNGQVAAGNDTDLRLRQQEILAELGVLALQGTPFPELLANTAALTAKGLEAEFCKVLEYQRTKRRFIVTAGVGWGPVLDSSAHAGPGPATGCASKGRQESVDDAAHRGRSSRSPGSVDHVYPYSFRTAL